MKPQLIKRILAYKSNPEIAKPLTDSEITEAIIAVYSLFQTINSNIEAGKVRGQDGYTPKEGIDYLGMSAALQMLNSIISDTESKTNETLSILKKHVEQRLSDLRDGEDAIITDEMLEETARKASLLINVPDFNALITAEPSAIRDSLELLIDDERLDIKAVRGVDEMVEDLRREIKNIQLTTSRNGGGLGRGQIIELINTYGSGVTDGDKTDITVSGDTWTLNEDTVGQAELDTTGTPDGTKFLRDDLQWTSIPGGGDMLQSTYDTDADGIVEQADTITSQGALATLNTVGTAQIDDDAVTFDKIQNVNTNKLIGRDTAGTGSVEEIAVGAGLEFSGASAIQVTNYNNLLDTSDVGVSNGVASLDSGGKVPASQLPNSIMDYKGTWAASTNTPTLANGTGNAGDVYVASDAGTVDFGAGNVTFAAGDWVIYSGSIWEKSINSNAVASVNGQTGAVTVEVVNDTTPQLGGNLDVNGFDITSASNGDVTIDPNGTGEIAMNGPTNFDLGGVASDLVPTADNSYSLGNGSNAWAGIYLNALQFGTNSTIYAGDGTTELLVLTNNASAVNQLGIANSATGNSVEISASGGDTNIDIEIVPKGTGTLVYTQSTATPVALGNLGATETIDFSAGHEQYGTLDSNVTITHSNEVSGRTVTLYLAYDGTAQRTITWSSVDKWLDGNNGSAPAAPAASGNELVVTLKFIGTTCYASATGNYAVY